MLNKLKDVDSVSRNKIFIDSLYIPYRDWRTDMDALPNDFDDNVDFKSIHKGVQHGSGHDVHMAIALGIAEVLVKHKKNLKGTVYFIFNSRRKLLKAEKRWWRLVYFPK